MTKNRLLSLRFLLLTVGILSSAGLWASVGGHPTQSVMQDSVLTKEVPGRYSLQNLDNALYYLDGKVITEKEYKALSEDEIESRTLLRRLDNIKGKHYRDIIQVAKDEGKSQILILKSKKVKK